MTRLQELAERIAARDVHVGVIGLGYVGLPLALEFVRAGLRVTGFEIVSLVTRPLDPTSAGRP